jgi:SAM-dependent methyltransferase/alpha-beta hydrolase superfamily lysophospholipase
MSDIRESQESQLLTRAGDPIRLPDSDRLTFTTEFLTLENKTRMKIFGYYDFLKDNHLPAPVILMPAAYGETKESNLLISAYMVSNGFRGLRFDWTDHVGESDGDMFRCKLSKMKDDFLAVLDYVTQRYPTAPVAVFATSLAGRIALKAAGCDSRINVLVCYAPVVSVESTLKMVYREDLFKSYRAGKRYGGLDVLGVNIDADGFLGDAIEESFYSLRTTMQDASNITAPTLFFLAERDSWVSTEEVRAVFEAVSGRAKRLTFVPRVLHRLVENRQATREVLKETVNFITHNVPGTRLDEQAVIEPFAPYVEAREKNEKNRLREIYNRSKTEEKKFWEKYLSNFSFAINVHDYWTLLELIYNLLGNALPGQKILDAGCGNGSYGLFVLSKQLYRFHQNPFSMGEVGVRYFGIDFVWKAIRQAAQKITDVQDEFRRERGLAHHGISFMQAHLLLADLEAGIPFPSNFFDQVCCNLVISYVEKPVNVLQDLCRVLRPGGKLMVSSLKPNADLSEVYRNFVSVAESEDEIDEARKLLANAGMIRVKAIRGLYGFYTRVELRELVCKAGLVQAKAFRSFGDQANLVVARKPS